MTTALWSLVQAIFTAGGLVGALSAGPLSSGQGRLITMRLTAVFAVVGSIVEVFAPTTGALIAGRFLTGVAAGASTVAVPMYISEVAPASARGIYGFMTQIFINIGIVASQGLGLFLSHGGAWRWILAAGLVIAIAQAIGLFFVAESPAWLAARGHTHRAKTIIRNLRGKGADISDEVAALGIGSSDEQEPFLDEERAPALAPARRQPSTSRDKGSIGAFAIIKDKSYRPAIVAVIGVMVAQQLCGINSIIVYSVGVLQGLLPVSSALVTVLISCVNLLATLAFSPLPDRLGRRTCLMLSIAGQGISALVMAISILTGVKIVSALAAFAFVASFAVGLGPVAFMLASEMVGQEAVAATQSWALASSYVATFAVVQSFPLINDGLNMALGKAGWVYFIFSGLALVSLGFVYFRIPETNGKKDADEVWGRTRRLD